MQRALSFYSGPQVSQSWSLFAPDPPDYDLRVLIQGRTRTQRLTSWYNVTDYFLQTAAGNRLTPTRALSEALFHSTTVIKERTLSQWDVAMDETVRTSTMVIERYVPKSQLSAIRIAIYSSPIGYPAATAPSALTLVKQTGWRPVPVVTLTW